MPNAVKRNTNKIIIDKKLTTLNEYINAERRNRYIAAKIKHKETKDCAKLIKKQMAHGVAFDWPCKLHFIWHLKNKRKDPDGVAFAKKFILDGMQEAGFVENDNPKYIIGFVDDFVYDGKDFVEIEQI